MHSSSSAFFLLTATATCFIFLGAGALQRLQTNGSCIHHERDALLAFKHGITEDPDGLLASWQQGSQDCCRWGGITCSNQTGHVLGLELYGYRLEGQISPSLLSLQNLENLNLSSTYLSGPNGSIPEFLGSLSNLRSLDLSNMLSFRGVLPPQLGNLSKLEYLDLSSTPLSGKVPPQIGNLSNLRHLGLGPDLWFQSPMYSTDISWLSHLHLLEYLDMSYVDLSLAIDWPHVVNMIPSLGYLRLINCSLASANQSLTHLNLTKLVDLDLSSNYFVHLIADSWFWNLTSIKNLFLSDTYLYGPFPNTLGGMTSLQIFFFENNFNAATMTVDLKNLCDLENLHLDESLSSGNIADFVEKLPQCTSNKLQWLSLRYNNMTGALPKTAHLTGLFMLDLSNNYLRGAIPSWIGNLTSLQELYLSNNHLTTLPSDVGMLTNLTILDLSYNRLDGVITEDHFANLKSLEYIDFSHNSFKIEVSLKWIPPFILKEAYFASCQMGPLFPTWLKFQLNVSILDISSTGLVEQLPDWFSTTFRKTRYLNISNNQISGVLPGKMEDMQFEEFYLNSNKLTGQIPLLSKILSRLDLSQNSFSGPLPLDFGAPNLVEMILSSNYFTGHIPKSICDLQDLVVLDLSNNLMDGELPQCFHMPKMAFLLLSNNKLSGEFPSKLQRCSGLVFLDLAWNKFSGALPVWIGDLVFLRFLQLSHNMFYGDIPVNITNLKRLRHLNLASNSISGVIPRSLSNLLSMAQKHPKRPGVDMLFWYESSVGKFGEVLSVVMKRQELKYGAGIFEMVGIDLSNNHLIGVIPDEIASLNGVLNLNLSRNRLSGRIPNNIGAMKSLESLDFSTNNLSGEIPTSLSDLTYLSCLDLSYNNLSGRIPQGRQLDTLYTNNPSMYDGNNGLCGSPLQRNCSSYNPPEHGNEMRSKNYSEPMFFYFGLVSGFVVGLWLVFCALLFKKAWRIAYFRFFDKVHDKAYVLVVVTCARFSREATTN